MAFKLETCMVRPFAVGTSSEPSPGVLKPYSASESPTEFVENGILGPTSHFQILIWHDWREPPGNCTCGKSSAASNENSPERTLGKKKNCLRALSPGPKLGVQSSWRHLRISSQEGLGPLWLTHLTELSLWSPSTDHKLS